VNDPRRPAVDDLFGDDETGGGAPPPPGPPPARRGRAGVRVAIAGAVLGLGALFWFLSMRHHERYFLTVEDGTIAVERGLWFPFGTSEFRPSRAYAPLQLPAGVLPERTGAMSVQELDDVLLKLFLGIAEREIADLEKGDMDRAEDVLLRAGKLGHIDLEDDRKVGSLMGDVHYRRGLTEVRVLTGRFDDALRHFELAARHGGARYRGADRWVESIRRLREEFRHLSVESGLDPEKVLAEPPPAPPSAKLPAAEAAGSPPPARAPAPAPSEAAPATEAPAE
jgi:hypothetical protein